MTDTTRPVDMPTKPLKDFRPLDAEAVGIQPSKWWFLALLLLGATTLMGQMGGLTRVLPFALDEGRLAIVEKQLADRQQSLAAIESEYEALQNKLSALRPQVQKASLSLETNEKDCVAARTQRDDLLVQVSTLTKRKDAAEEELAALSNSR